MKRSVTKYRQFLDDFLGMHTRNSSEPVRVIFSDTIVMSNEFNRLFALQKWGMMLTDALRNVGIRPQRFLRRLYARNKHYRDYLAWDKDMDQIHPEIPRGEMVFFLQSDFLHVVAECI